MSSKTRFEFIGVLKAFLGSQASSSGISGGIGGRCRVKTILVIIPSFLLIREDLVCGPYLLKSMIISSFVGVVLYGQLPVGLFDFFLTGIFTYLYVLAASKRLPERGDVRKKNEIYELREGSEIVQPEGNEDVKQEQNALRESHTDF
jgi:hypothetical protein